ncbi:MAG: hypothetical protein WBE37_11945 [Bryobacteraceae bacterium]
MNTLKTRLFQAGAAIVVLSALILATPRAAHSLAAALVEVANTPANPVVTQGVPALASQIVTLVPSGNGPAGVTSAGAFTLSSLPQWSAAVNSGGIEPFAPPYVVPAGQSLVITSIDLAEISKSGTDTVILANSAVPSGQFNVAPLGNWVATLLVPCSPGPTTTQYHFSPGLVFSAGQNVWMSDVAGLQGSLIAEVHGYLTSN